MKRVTRLLMASVVIASLAVVSPASADHDHPAGTDWPAGAPNGLHEERPDTATVVPLQECIFQGGILANSPTAGGPQHSLPGGGADPAPSFKDPAHSHFALIGETAVINCGPIGTVLDLEGDGGNDGHIHDNHDAWEPGGNGDIIENDPVDDRIDCDTIATPPGQTECDDHDFNSHHGAVTESGWSNSSGYSRGAGGGSSNDCLEDDHDGDGLDDNQNKADVVAGGTFSGWLKYVRLGVMMTVWGCVEGLPGTSDRFSGTLFVAANPATPGAAADLLGTIEIGNAWASDGEAGT